MAGMDDGPSVRTLRKYSFFLVDVLPCLMTLNGQNYGSRRWTFHEESEAESKRYITGRWHRFENDTRTIYTSCLRSRCGPQSTARSTYPVEDA